MPDQISALEITLLAAGVTFSHLFLFIMGRKVNTLYILLSVILVLAAFSGASGFALGTLAKLVRGYALLLLIGLAFFRYRTTNFSTASLAWLFFLTIFTLSAFWSDWPPSVLFHKAQAILVALAGIIAAYSVSGEKQLMQGLRTLLVGGVALGIGVLLLAIFESGGAFLYGRINLGGVVATRLASNVAPLLLVCTYLAIYDRSKAWKPVEYATVGLLASILLLTGARGPAAAAVLGFLIQLLPRGGRRLRVLALPVLIACSGLIVLGALREEVKVERLLSTANTRAAIWRTSMEEIVTSPMIGHGGLLVGPPGALTRFNTHNAWLQIVIEQGLLGLALFGVCALVVCGCGVQMYRLVSRHPPMVHLAIFPVSIIMAALFHGTIEISLIAPSSFALLVGLSIGLIDHLPRMALRSQGVLMQYAVWGNVRRQFPPNLPGRLRPGNP